MEMAQKPILCKECALDRCKYRTMRDKINFEPDPICRTHDGPITEGFISILQDIENVKGKLKENGFYE